MFSVKTLSFVAVTIIVVVATLAFALSHNNSSPKNSMYNLPNESNPAPNLYASGQPSAEQFKTLKQDGFTTVVSLKDPSEYGGVDVPSQITSTGMAYLNIPISNGDDLTAENAEKLHNTIENAPGKVLVFCGSSNRVGGLLALDSYLNHDKTKEEALAFGESAGLTGLKPTVKKVLDNLEKK